ncbi:MAG TPA: amino acid aminotransferase [Caldimonas sp.]
MSSFFDAVEMAPRDPILGLNEQFLADPNPNKVNLGVGVYYDENGKLPLLGCIRAAEEMMMEAPQPRGYLPIDGIAAYDAATQALVFGTDCAARREGRIATVQAIGGTGGLKVGADLLQRMNPKALVLISEPSWENHRALFEGAGFEVATYAYYDAARQGVDFAAMRASLEAATPGTIVVLHACCHNPTGCDLTAEQWAEVVSLLGARRLVPFLDMAYQGFGDGIAEDGRAVQMCLAAGLDFFVATSFSKSFSLYGERVGALSVVCASADAATRVLSQLKRVIRTNYSNPPTHGAAAITKVLSTPALRAMWEGELAGMRERIKRMRFELQRRLVAAGAGIDTDFITRQRGMFSYSGLTKSQMQRLRSEFGVYGVDSGRICVAALNEHNLDAVVEAISQVTEKASA